MLQRNRPSSKRAKLVSPSSPSNKVTLTRGFARYLPDKILTPISKEEKLNMYLHPYNNSIEVRPYMIFSKDQSHEIAPCSPNMRSSVEEHWSFLANFIFKNEDSKFKSACNSIRTPTAQEPKLKSLKTLKQPTINLEKIVQTKKTD